MNPIDQLGTVPCPDPACGQQATIVERWVLRSTDGPMDHVRIQCPNDHVFTAPMDFLRTTDVERFQRPAEEGLLRALKTRAVSALAALALALAPNFAGDLAAQQQVLVVNPNNNPVRVRVNNAVSSPVNVRDVESPLREPFQTSISTSFDLNIGSAQFSVPAGKRLVIEHLSARVSVPVGQTAETRCATTIAGVETFHFLDITFQTSGFGLDTMVGSEPVRLYADGPGRVLCQGLKSVSGGGTAFTNWSFSGHLVDRP